MKKAIIFARVSSKTQDTNRQVLYLKEFAKEKDFEIVHEPFTETMSAFKRDLKQRVEFQIMYDYLKKHNIKHLLVSEISRLSRRNVDTTVFLHECAELGICVYFQKEGIKSLNDEGKVDISINIVLSVLSNIAEFETRTLSYRVKTGKRNSTLKGLGFNKKIFGYDRGKDGTPEEGGILPVV